jgi:hypothetical protein
MDNSGQAPENIKVIPLDDVATCGGRDYTPEVWRNTGSHGLPPLLSEKQIPWPQKCCGISRVILPAFSSCRGAREFESRRRASFKLCRCEAIKIRRH